MIKKAIYITKPEVTEKYIRIPTGNRCRVTSTIVISTKKGIKALYCGKIKKIRTYLFAKSKGWTMAKAQTWVKAHKSDLKEAEVIMESEMNTPQRFKLALPIMKTRVRIVKDENGNQKEERYVEGVASSTTKDLHGDKMTEACLRSMADSLKQHILHLNAEHDTSWQSELGDLAKLFVKDKKLHIEAKLNEMSKAKDLWLALTEMRKKLGLSIGGYVKEYEMVRDGKTDDGFPKWLRVFKEIELDHIAVTSRPANPATWVGVIAKSLDPTKEEEMMKQSESSGKKTVLELEDLDKDELLKMLLKISNETDDETVVEIIEGGVENVAEKETKVKDEELKKTEELEEETTEEENEDIEKAKKRKAEKPEVEEEEETDEDKDSEENDKETSGESDEDAEEESDDDEESEDESEEEESEEEDESEDESEESEEDDKEEDEDESVVEVSLKSGKLLKAIDGLNKQLKGFAKTNKTLTDRIAELETQPAGRKVVIDKTLGDENEADTSDPREAMDKKIADLKKTEGNNPLLFSMIQRTRAEYADKLK